MSGPGDAIPRVSLIVPVYGVAQYIERCCVSIFDQTFRDFEIVFVNDCTKDDSEAILLGVVDRYRDLGVATVLLRHEVNRGISAARETGLRAARGEFVLYIDSDDYIAPRMLESLVGRADATGADLVFCDYVEVRGGTETQASQAVGSSDVEAVLAAMLLQRIVWCPWNKLFRRSLAVDHDVHWPPGVNIGEDLVVITRLVATARRIEHVAEGLYYYNRDNVGSYLNVWKPASSEQNTRAVELVDSFLAQRRFGPAVRHAFTQTKLMARFMMLYTLDRGLMERLPETFPETDEAIFTHERAPMYWRVALYLVVKRWRLLSRLAIVGIQLMKRGRALGTSTAR